jgi:hypothetical protein
MEDARPVDVEKIRRLADTFYHFAREHVRRIKVQGRDPQILVRAVGYLARTHALKQMHDSTEWFFFMLRALVELACPDGRHTMESIGFLADVEDGIRLARVDAGRDDQS